VIRWRPLSKPQQVYANNVILGAATAIRARSHDVDAGNFAEPQSSLKLRSGSDDLVALGASSLQKPAVAGSHARSVTYDFFGLLRFPDLPQTIGAFRAEPSAKTKTASLVEVEFQDGTRRRLYETLP
jgi:hypothetical protein